MSKSLNLARFKRRQHQTSPSPVARINTLIRTAKANWFGLLSYHAFIGIALMGVKDADFFILSRETQLPLVGISVPTSLFFYVAPLCGAALHVHLHIYLLKLWRSLAEAGDTINGQPLGEHVSPWVVVDMALWKRPEARHSYALANLSSFGTIVLLFYTSPIVLFFFWYRSLPKHDEVLTLLFCGLPLVATVYATLHSLRTLDRAAKRLITPGKTLKTSAFVVIFALGLCTHGWMKTEGYERGDWIANILSPIYGADQGTNHLYPANLAGVDFIGMPDGWTDYDTQEREFRRNWCERHGMAMAVCGMGPRSDDAPEPFQTKQRLAYCHRLHMTPVTEQACAAFFQRMNWTYLADWQTHRRSVIAGLSKWPLKRVDLRQADLSEARLEGADLRFVRMQGAVLFSAHMENTDLRNTKLERADLSNANLEMARLSSADLRNSKMGEASLEGANLRNADLRGANISQASFRNADLRGIKIDPRHTLVQIDFAGSALGSVDLTNAFISQKQISSLFADATVVLPDVRFRPPHWPEVALYGGELSGEDTFHTQWHLWRADPEGYCPPPKPEE